MGLDRQILDRVNGINDRKANSQTKTGFDYTGFLFDPETSLWRLYNGNGYDDAYEEKEDSIQYHFREIDFVNFFDELIRTGQASLNVQSVAETTDYFKDSSYEYEYRLRQNLCRGTLRGLIKQTNFVLDLSEIRFTPESIPSEGIFAEGRNSFSDVFNFYSRKDKFLRQFAQQ